MKKILVAVALAGVLLAFFAIGNKPRTFVHDGHKWVYFGYRTTPVHHPECPCGGGR
jgi:hypothetical protein